MDTIKKVFLVICLSVVFSSLILFDGAPLLCEENKDSVWIIGKTFNFDYGQSAYSISIKSKSELHWELIKGEHPGPQKGNEKYHVSKVSDGILFISWTESSGLGLYNVMNFNTNELTTHGNEKGMTFIYKGIVKEVKKSLVMIIMKLYETL